MKRIIAILLCLLMAATAVACDGGNTPAETTAAPAPVETEAPATEAPVETTEAPVETTEAPETTEAVEATTEAPVETAPAYEFSSLSAADQAALKAVMPVSLPDYSTYEIVTRAMCFDAGTDEYVVAGNSKGSAQFVTVAEGAVFGQALKLAACDDGGTKRTEVEITPLADMDISTAKGVMFYVDFSNVVPNADETKKMCTSVTINTNKYRAKGPNNTNDGTAVAYYYMAGTWFQTTNINACRMEIPTNFAGWLYIPSSTFYGSDEGAALGETFGDIFVMNMRCYTDGYTYSADNYIIFDEIVFIK